MSESANENEKKSPEPSKPKVYFLNITFKLRIVIKNIASYYRQLSAYRKIKLKRLIPFISKVRAHETGINFILYYSLKIL